MKKFWKRRKRIFLEATQSILMAKIYVSEDTNEVMRNIENQIR